MESGQEMLVAAATGIGLACSCVRLVSGPAERPSHRASPPKLSAACSPTAGEDGPAAPEINTPEDTEVDFAALNAALGPRPPDEEVLFQAWQPGNGTNLASGWSWVRQECGWQVDTQSRLLLPYAPGGGGGPAAKLIRNLLVRDFPPVTHGWGRAAMVAVLHSCGTAIGEQAGLVWYHDDSNYLKLVLQVGQGGVVGVIFATVVGGVVRVIATKEYRSNQTTPANLRVEVGPSGESAAAILDLGYCEQLVGVAEDVSTLGLSGDAVRVGVMANGASDMGDQSTTKVATFSNFNMLALAPDRVSFAGTAQSVEGLTVYGQDSETVESGMQPASDLQGWTLSEELTSTERDEVAELLASVGPPPGGQQPAFSIIDHPQ